MSPHKPDPKFRKIDVDVSAILIRSDESDRPALNGNAPEASVSWFQERKRRPTAHFRRRTDWAGLVNLIFVSAACLLGFLCAPFVSNSPEYLRRYRHESVEARYARADLSDSASNLATSKMPSFVFHKPNQSNVSEQTARWADWYPNSLRLPPFERVGDLSSLQNGNPIADNGLNFLNSPSSGLATMSGTVSSNSQSTSVSERIAGRTSMTRSSVSRRHAQISSLTSQKKVSAGRQKFFAWLFSGTRTATVAKSSMQSRQQNRSDAKLNSGNQQHSLSAFHSGLERSAMGNRPHSVVAGIAAMQNPASPNMVPLQNTMMSQAAFHGGGGLGGLGGSHGNLGAAAHR